MSLFNLGAPSWLWEAINSLWLMLCKWIYIGINWFYQVFEKVASVNLFSTEVFKEITSRIYVVMGIAMLFIFAYNLVLMIINPEDKKGSGAMGKVVKETMISLTVVVLLPTIFNYMYVVQSHILESNIIGQIIMGSVGSTTSDRSNCDADDYDCLCDFSKFEELNNYSGYHNGWIFKYDTTTTADEVNLIKNACETYRGYNGSKITDSQRGAFSIAPTVFSAFYRPTNFSMEDCENYLVNNDTSVLTDDKSQKICINYYFDINMSKYTGNIAPFVGDDYLNAIISDSADSSMEFDWLFALIAGGLAVWMFICYAMEIGVRVAKLGLLQIISPIAVMMRVIPGQKEKIFDKWFTHLKNTYLDVFIRLVIIYFSLFAISLVPDVIKTLWISTISQEAASSNLISGFFIKTLALVVVILGILKFAQEAPALIKEFFGDSGRFALKSPGKQLSENKLAMGGLGAIGGGLSSMAGNSYKAVKDGKKLGAITSGLGGLVGGARRGAKEGYSAKDFSGLKKGIMQAKYESDEARDKHIATRQKGAIKTLPGAAHARAEEIPFASSVIGGVKEKWDDIKSGGKEFGRFISGEGAADFRAQAVADALSKTTGIKSTFKNAFIEAIENAQSKTNEEYNSNKKINVKGVDYERKEDGKWHGSNGSTFEHKEMGDHIKDAFDEMKRVAYAERYSKNTEAYAELSKSMITSLTDNMNKIGNNFSEKFFNKLNEDGLNMNVENMSDFTNQIESLQKTNGLKDKQIQENFEKLYKINEAVEDVLKSQKLQNAAAEQAKKDSK